MSDKKVKVLAHELVVTKLEELAKNIAAVLCEGNSAAAYYGFPMVDCLCAFLENMVIEPLDARVHTCLVLKLNVRDRFTVDSEVQRMFWNRLHTTIQQVLGEDVCGKASEDGGATVPLEPNQPK